MKKIKRDNPYDNYFDSLKLSILCERLTYYRRSKGLMQPAIDLLSIVCNSYLLENKGLTVYELSYKFDPANYGIGDRTKIRQKVNRLVDRGYLCESGFGRYGSTVYIPTTKALEELSELCK